MPTPSVESDANIAQALKILNQPRFTVEDEKRAKGFLDVAETSASVRLKKAKLAADALEVGIRTADNSGFSTVESDFNNFLRSGKNSVPTERRAQSFGTDSAGGFLVPASFREQLDVALKAVDGIFAASGVWESETGSALSVPILNDVSSTANIIAENSLIAEQDINVFDALVFSKTPSWKSGICLVSVELVQDSFFPLQQVLAEAFATRFARGIGKYLITQLISAADVGATTASPTAIAASELLDLMNSLDSAYWGNASWCMSKSTWIALMKLGAASADSAAQAVSMFTAPSLRLFDRPVFICPNMDSIAATKKCVSFGNHAKLLQRRVANSLRVQVLTERFIPDGLQYGYSALWRVDAGLLKPSPGSPATSQSPVQILQMHS